MLELRLADLNPQPLICEDGGRQWRHVDSLAAADGVMFLCPVCFAALGGPVGTHSVVCWFRGKVADDVAPLPGRWKVAGTDMANLTLSPSIAIRGGCSAHFFIRDGSIVLAG